MNAQVQPELDLLLNKTPTGFRLQRMELYNWGTFHNSVWQIDPNGNNSLLTGDIGSGKSTVVDALTTLLVPAQKITFNKAAGAESKERNLNSYVRGAYKSEKSELTQRSKAVTLRDETSYTVLLAWFYNEDFKQGLTLAQVFWLKEGNSNPERFYLTAEVPLTIKESFGNFGGDINKLKLRLRRRKKVTISPTFREYSTLFRRCFGLQSEQALDLFYQTVSMKSVGNLTDFVRIHMLEKTDTEAQLDLLLRGFDNLNRLHDAVLKARLQIEQLTPLCNGLEKYTTLQQQVHALREARSVLASWFARFQQDLLQTQIKTLQQQSERLEHQLEKISTSIEALRDKENDLRHTIEDKGGRRLREIERDIKQLQQETQRAKQHYGRYDKACQQLELDAQLDEKAFYANQHQLPSLAEGLAEKELSQQQERDQHAIQLSLQRKEHSKLAEEIASLKQRKSNIPMKTLVIRQGLIDTLQLNESELPFVGELLQVDEGQAVWEGAIERVLHNFGLSLLVPERHYQRVSQYVEKTHLKGRLVYFRITDEKQAKANPEAGSLAEKVRIKPESEFYDWLEHALSSRFNYQCTESVADFRRHPYAMTQNGQIKAGRQRHEKDDRFAIHDRRRYVLGWSNQEKLTVLEAQHQTLVEVIEKLALLIKQVEHQQKALQQQNNALRDMQQIAQFSRIDWQSSTVSIEQLEQEHQSIKSSSDVLKQLQLLLEKSIAERKEQEQQEKSALNEQGTLSNKLQNAENDLNDAQIEVAEFTDEVMETHEKRLQQWRDKVVGDSKLNLRNLSKRQREMREAMSTSIGNDTAKLDKLTQRLIQQMQDYKRNYPAETSESDARLEAGHEYAEMLQRLASEDLPRHEKTFKKMLNEQTIQGVVMFQSQLDKERRHIEDKITAINQSLQQIEYSRGTYITLLANLALDVDVRDFRSDLKAILSNTLGNDNDELYTEDRFLHVKAMMERFRGREGLVEQDRRWTKKVIDVRNWYNFSASERWRENDEEKEFYSDSAGKSGGQKEKLAYTILASALAYQFGLESGENSHRSFRFVVIDEAFGKGSDESTRYALELFRKLNLQLLIVTPLQKIHVIEDYIHGVHFVHNREGKYSMLRNLSIDEYQQEKAKVI